MLWIILIVIIIMYLFLWIIVRNSSKSIDEETQRLLDEEQTRAVEEYLRENEQSRTKKADSSKNR